MQPDKVSAILELPAPSTKKSLRSFLGMVFFYRRFIPNATELSAALTDLLQGGSGQGPISWTSEAQESFTNLKACLASQPFLKLPDLKKTFILRTDSSSVGIGAVLLQYHDDCPFPVCYASRKLSSSERNYSTIERECLALVFGTCKFQMYLFGREFVLETDHKPLVYLSSMKGQNSRLMRWALCLAPFRFRIVYIPGCDNVGADILSRAGT